MSNNFFNDEDEGEFRDVPEEVSGQDAPVPSVRTPRPVAPQPAPVQQQVAQPQQEVYEEHVSDDEEDYSSVLNDARLRLEQGKLYEMLMNHDIFEGADVDERAVKFVTRQIRNFAKEQMEIMLGMRQEAPKAQALSAENFPFNDLEVMALKALARTATKGATDAPEAQTFASVQQPAAPRRVGLNTIGVKAKPVTPQARPVQKSQSAIAPQKPLQSRPAAPVQRKVESNPDIDRILAEEGITREEYDRTFGNYQPIGKPLHKMTEQEILERNRAIAAKKTPRPPTAIPMPSIEQENMLHSQRVQSAEANPQMQTIMNLLTTANAKK